VVGTAPPHLLERPTYPPPSPETKASKPSAIILNLYAAGPGQCTEGIHQLDLAKEDRGGRHDGGRADRPTTWDTRTTLASGASSGSEDQHGKFEAVHPGRDRQYNHTPRRAATRLRSHDAILEAVSRRRHDRHRSGDQGLEGHEFDGLKRGRPTSAPGPPARAGRARRAGLGKERGWATIRSWPRCRATSSLEAVSRTPAASEIARFGRFTR